MSYRQLLVPPFILTALILTASLAQPTQAREPVTLREFGRMFWPVELSKKSDTQDNCEVSTCLQRGDYFFVELDIQPRESYGNGWLRTIASSNQKLHKFPVSFEIEYEDEAAGTFKVLRLLFFDHVNSQPPTLIKQMTIVPITGDKQACMDKLFDLSSQNFSRDERESQCDEVAPLVHWKINTLAVKQDSKIVPMIDEIPDDLLSHPEDGQGTGKGQ